MILHVTFTDGSSPFVLYGDRKTIAKKWRQYVKNVPEARPTVYAGKYNCCQMLGRFIVQHEYNPHESHGTYKQLGRALAALERLGGEST